MQATVQECFTASNGEVVVVAIAVFGDTGRDPGFQAFEFAVEYKIDNASQRVGTVSG